MEERNIININPNLAYILELPNDLLIVIAGYLALSDLLSCLRVSKKFHKLLNNGINNSYRNTLWNQHISLENLQNIEFIQKIYLMIHPYLGSKKGLFASVTRFFKIEILSDNDLVVSSALRNMLRKSKTGDGFTLQKLAQVFIHCIQPNKSKMVLEIDPITVSFDPAISLPSLLTQLENLLMREFKLKENEIEDEADILCAAHNKKVAAGLKEVYMNPSQYRHYAIASLLEKKIEEKLIIHTPSFLSV